MPLTRPVRATGTTLLTAAAALTALTAGAAPASADTMYGWVVGGPATCTVTAPGHATTKEKWSFQILVDDNGVTWPVGQPIPAQTVAIGFSAEASSFTRAAGTTSVHGSFTLNYHHGEVPIKSTLVYPPTVISGQSEWSNVSGKGQPFTPTRVGDYPGMTDSITADLTTDTGDARHLECTLDNREDGRLGTLRVVDPTAPEPTPSSPVTPTSSSPSPATPSPSAPAHTSDPATPGTSTPAGTPKPTGTATPSGPVVQTDQVSESPATGLGLVAAVLAAIAGVCGAAVRRRG